MYVAFSSSTWFLIKKYKIIQAYNLFFHLWPFSSWKCSNDNDDNDNILFDHNLQIEITIYNSLENKIIYTLVWRLLLRQNNLLLAL